MEVGDSLGKLVKFYRLRRCSMMPFKPLEFGDPLVNFGGNLYIAIEFTSCIVTFVSCSSVACMPRLPTTHTCLKFSHAGFF